MFWYISEFKGQCWRSLYFTMCTVCQGTKIFQYCTCPAGRVTYNFHSSCKHMHLSFKSVCNKELCNMTYKVIYITAKMIFIPSQFHNCISQSVKCLATDGSLTADPGVTSSTPAQSHTVVEIDHEIISMVIFLPSAESFKKSCCQLQAKVCARSTG